MKPVYLTTSLFFLVLCNLSYSLGNQSLGDWHKDQKHGFWIRTPEKWAKINLPKNENHRIGFWVGPRIKTKVKNIGTMAFSTQSSIVWIEKKSKRPLTLTEKFKIEKNKEERKVLTEAERKLLLKERSQRIKARSFEQWLNNYSGYTGLRILEKKECELAKKPAVEVVFLSKTNQQANIKHLAFVVRLNVYNDLVLVYSVLEEEFSRWKPFFYKCAKTLRVLKDKSADHDPLKPETPQELKDIIITNHGKIFEGQVSEKGDVYFIDVDGGKITTPKALIKKVEYVSPVSEPPKTEEEKKKAANGYVKFQGKWISSNRFKLERKRELQKIRDKIDGLKKHSDPANPWRAKTSRFILETTTSQELLNHYVELFDAHMTAFEQRFKINISKEARKRKPIVRIFKDRAEYMNFTRAFGTGGYFSFVDNTLHLFHNFEDPALTASVLLHEGAHLLNYLSNTRFAGRPHWIEEGVAEYFGSSKISRNKRGKLILEPGQILGNRLLFIHNLVATRKVNNLRAALATKSYKYPDYAYWWSFVHFMIHSEEYGNKFLKFYRKLYALRNVEGRKNGDFVYVSSEESVKAFEKSLKIKDWDLVQAKWEQFIVDNVEKVGGYGWMVLGRDLYFESFKRKAVEENAKKGEELDGKSQKTLLEESMEALNRSIEEKGYVKAEAFYYRAMAYKEIFEYQKGLQDINRSIELDPLNDRYYSRRAVFQYLLGEKELAVRDMHIAKALNPNNLIYPIIIHDMRMGSFIDLSRG